MRSGVAEYDHALRHARCKSEIRPRPGSKVDYEGDRGQQHEGCVAIRLIQWTGPRDGTSAGGPRLEFGPGAPGVSGGRRRKNRRIDLASGRKKRRVAEKECR